MGVITQIAGIDFQNFEYVPKRNTDPLRSTTHFPMHRVESDMIYSSTESF